MENRPLLFRLARRQAQSSVQLTQYDAERDELFVETPLGWEHALDAKSGPPRTKKADIETGEDVKGRW
jgi:hypothetical protein